MAFHWSPEDKVDLAKFVGLAVKHHRELVRLSQEDLAERSGLDRTYISGVERGRRNPTVRVLQRIVEGLGIDLDVLFASARELSRAATGHNEESAD